MSGEIQCNFCHHFRSALHPFCQHCARLDVYPNVRKSAEPQEREALEQRYANEKAIAKARGVGDLLLQELETKLDQSVAVIARPIAEVLRLVTSDNELYATYYELIAGGVKIPQGGEWDKLRRMADALFFCGFEKDIRFAALSLDGRGLPYWGECFIVLRTELIAHRASLLQENSVLWMKRYLSKFDFSKLPRGHIATWEDRKKLAVAKLGYRLEPKMAVSEFATILMEGAGQDADFVEVHVWGPMTRRTCERVLLARKHDGDDGDVRVAKINQTLSECGATVEPLQ
jgi:hypothetical protein